MPGAHAHDACGAQDGGCVHKCRLFELRTKERELISEISGGQGQNKNMASRIAQLDEQVRLEPRCPYLSHNFMANYREEWL